MDKQIHTQAAKLQAHTRVHPPTLAISGASWSYHCLHSPSLRKTESGMSRNESMEDRAMMLSHTLSGIQSLGFLRTCGRAGGGERGSYGTFS